MRAYGFAEEGANSKSFPEQPNLVDVFAVYDAGWAGGD